MKIVERSLTVDEDKIPGYLACPERKERGPAVLLIHRGTGLTNYLKIEALKFARFGYTTVVPSLYELLGFPPVTDAQAGRGIRAKTSDSEFIRVIDQGWQYLLSRPDVDPGRVAVGGYCMGGRIGIHFAAATPKVRAFVGYSPTVRDETITPLRPLPPWEAARLIRCPSIVLYGAHDRVTTLSLQTRLWEAFLANGQPLEWHCFPFGGHGFVDPETFGYQPQAAELAWPLVVGFLERELIAEAVPDKQEAYAEIYKSYYARVVRLSRLLLSDPDEAKEVSQDVFFKLFKEYQSRNSTMAWGPWLMRVTINACRDRQRSAWWKWLRAPMEEFQEADHACHGQTPEEAMVWREERGRIWGSLQQLSSRQREVFVLRHVEGWSTQEVAETLQLSPGSVKRHLFRAVCHLRKALGSGS